MEDSKINFVLTGCQNFLVFLQSAADLIVVEESTNSDNVHISTDLLNEVSKPGILHKIDAMYCTLIRNLNFEQGLANGTQVKAIGRYSSFIRIQ